MLSFQPYICPLAPMYGDGFDGDDMDTNRGRHTGAVMGDIQGKDDKDWNTKFLNFIIEWASILFNVFLNKSWEACSSAL